MHAHANSLCCELIEVEVGILAVSRRFTGYSESSSARSCRLANKTSSSSPLDVKTSSPALRPCDSHTWCCAPTEVLTIGQLSRVRRNEAALAEATGEAPYSTEARLVSDLRSARTTRNFKLIGYRVRLGFGTQGWSGKIRCVAEWLSSVEG